MAQAPACAHGFAMPSFRINQHFLNFFWIGAVPCTAALGYYMVYAPSKEQLAIDLVSDGLVWPRTRSGLPHRALTAWPPPLNSANNIHTT